eukprot:CAMPEP_0194752844 /NCGR_PEP_ID=MMETSP0323_2-20130528/6740_1 /TAXON_ID=2866 ORGANISM="Crypthecodinium cohnii, Strain Seligo" /NCGR_SAMPLE_ID=MMETSP0323_2 /ASSEMBLY_ACC=CAM_ASM_000346 /LENGTH=73 /DNA_ID=CAMNT_0039670183 /DNA_START=62 /DNA_END=281 /DNA_ORIENTATION=+
MSPGLGGEGRGGGEEGREGGEGGWKDTAMMHNGVQTGYWALGQADRPRDRWTDTGMADAGQGECDAQSRRGAK